MYQKIKDYVVGKYKEGHNVRVHITQIGYEPNHKYNTSLGVYVDDEFDEVFELSNISNNEIEELKSDLNRLIRENTLYLI